MTTSSVIIKGNINRREFAEPYRQCCEMLEQIGIACQVNPMNLNAVDPAGFFVFFQSYPYEFLSSDLAKLRRANPLAPLFFVLGVCCEGMQRTAEPLDSPFYTHAHAWNERDTEQMRLFLTDRPSLFALPPTVGADEIAVCRAYGNAFRNAASEAAGCLIITHFGPFGNDTAMNLLLADEQRHLGHKPVFSDGMLPDAFSGIILADADNSPTEKILDSIQRLRRRFADNDFTVYIDSPRIDEKTGCIQAGATRVLAKMR